MKKQLKTAFAAALALVIALALVPFSAFAETEPTWTVPEGYNEHDYNKIVTFLEQTDENGVKNGAKLSESYDPNDPATWGKDWVVAGGFEWKKIDDERKLWTILIFVNNGLCGILDTSGCTALEQLHCNKNSLTGLDASGCVALTELSCEGNSITELNLSGCTALKQLDCSDNNLTKIDVSHLTELSSLKCGGNSFSELDVTQNTSLTSLHCRDNSLTKLDVTQNTALESFACFGNNLTELDLSNNPALSFLQCGDNNLTELDLGNNPALKHLTCNGLTEVDLSNNPEIACDRILSDGNGQIGCFYFPKQLGNSRISAYTMNGSSFEGFYDVNGTLISKGQLKDEAYIYSFPIDEGPTGTIIARFSGGTASNDTPANPGDTNAATNEKPAKSGSTLVIVLAIVAAVAVIGAIGFIMMKKKRAK